MIVFRSGLALTLGVVATTAARAAPQLTEFDAPGATKVNSQDCSPYCGTFAYGNNASGTVVGYYTDKNIVPFAFIRAATGTFTHFQVKGAGVGHGLNEGTVAYSINDRGEIAGQYEDANLVYHGFVRMPDGHVIRFDAPDAGTGASQGTWAEAINNSGTVAGYYVDANNVLHGFVRARGTISEYDPPGSTDTYVFGDSINNAGTVVSFYYDANLVRHGYARAADGTITSPLDCPGAGTGQYQGTFTESVNDANETTGGFDYPSGGIEAFVLPLGGQCSDFSVTKAGALATAGLSIDNAGIVAGQYADINHVLHGFVREKAGHIATFSAPGAGTGEFQGTAPESRYQPGFGVAGTYSDANNLNHGFIWVK